MTELDDSITSGSTRIPRLFLIVLAASFALWCLLPLFSYSPSLALISKVVVLAAPVCALSFSPQRGRTAEYLALTRFPSVKWILLSTALLLAYLVTLGGGWTGVHSVSLFFVVSAIVISPVVEEIAFRGAVLGQLARALPYWGANLLTTLLFVLYHVPLWLARGQGVSLVACLWVAVLSLWLGYVLRKSGSTWTCVIVHGINNLLLGVL